MTIDRATASRPALKKLWVLALTAALPLAWTLDTDACSTRRTSSPQRVTTSRKPTTSVKTTTQVPQPEKVVTTTPKTSVTATDVANCCKCTCDSHTKTTTTTTTTTPLTPNPERVSPIPEPSTALIGLGLLGAVGLARRIRTRGRSRSF